MSQSKSRYNPSPKDERRKARKAKTNSPWARMTVSEPAQATR